jgi:iron(III) transport system permease protein
MNWPLLVNSLLVSALTTVLAGALGVAVALCGMTLGPRGRRRLLAAGVVALVLPSFLAVNAWLELLGAGGVLRRWLPVNLYSLPGAIGILTLLHWPWPMLAALAAWRKIPAEHLDADPALRGLALGRWLLWPAARASLAQSLALVFVLALNNFAVPTILQVKVLPAELWLKLNTQLDPWGALAVSWPLVLAPLLLLLALARADTAWPRETGPAAAPAWRRQLGDAAVRTCGAIAVLALALSVAVPLGQLAASPRAWRELPGLLRAAPGTVWNSFWLAALTATLGVGAALLSWRWRIGLFLWTPLLVPGVLLATGATFLWQRLAPAAWLGGFSIVIAVFAARYLAPAWNLSARALRTADPALLDAARLDGASGWALFQHGYWPQIAPSVASGWLLTYLLCLWDVEAMVLIVPPGGETLALRVFNLLHYGHHAQVDAMCLLLVALALAPLAGWRLWHKLNRERTDE